MKNFLEEFKKFAIKGNVFDLAVGVVIGTSFTAIVNSIVNDIIMPAVGIILGGKSFKGLTFTVGDAVIQYGNLIQNFVDFLIVALVLFYVVKLLNVLRFKKEEAKEEKVEEPKKSDEVILLEEIRDLIANNKKSEE